MGKFDHRHGVYPNCRAAMTRDDAVLAIDQHGIGKAELPDLARHRAFHPSADLRQ
jgi:hypothetical protein